MDRRVLFNETTWGILAAGLGVGIVFWGHAAFGANTRLAGLAITAAMAGYAALLLLLNRRAVSAVRISARLMALLLATVSVAFLTASPVLPAAIRSLDPSTTFQEAIKLAGFGFAFLAGAIVARRRAWADALLQLFVIAFLLYGLITMLDWFTAPGASFPPDETMDRFRATFGSPNSAATVFGLGVVTSLAALRPKARRGAPIGGVVARLLATLCVAVSICGLTLTASRGGVLATIVASAYVIAATWAAAHSSRRRSLVLLIVLLTGIFTMLVATFTGLLDRFHALPSDVKERQVLYASHWRAFLDHAWFGTGLGTFDVRNLGMMTPANAPYLWNLRAAHNLGLEWLASAGIIGTLPMAAASGMVIWRLAVANLVTPSAIWPRIAMAAVGLVLVHGTVDFALQEPSIALTIALLAGAGFAQATLTRSSSRSRRAARYRREAVTA